MAQRGLAAIAAAFGRAAQAGRAAFMPYFTLGFPAPEASLAAVRAIAPFSDLIELGLPFSDPLADGPTIQRSTQRALEAGTTIASCLASVAALRSAGLEVPCLLMGYYNPILAYGQERFVAAAAEAGADGLIVPDLPPEEGAELATEARAAGLALVRFVAPTTSPERLALILGAATGFVYVVSLTGVTGARERLEENLEALVTQVRAKSALPVAVGFGVSTPAQAAAVGRFADGVIVGSALIDAYTSAGNDPRAAANFAQAMRVALAVGRQPSSIRGLAT